MGLALSILRKPVDVNLFKKEMGWKWIAGGDLRPVKAMVFRFTAMCMPTRFHYPPKQLRAATAQGCDSSGTYAH